MATTWKATERAVARCLGGQRIPVTGRAGQPDIRHPWLAIEVKHRASLPKWLKQAVLQARVAATTHQLPVAILHEHGTPHGDDLVVLRLADFQAWFGD